MNPTTNRSQLYELTLTRRPLQGRRPADASLGASVRTPVDAVHASLSVLGGRVREYMLVLHLDARHTLIGFEEVAHGSQNVVHVHASDVFRGALVGGANAIIVAHNHPSGDPLPSEEDRALTKGLHAAGDLLGMTVLDHLIIGDGRFYAFSTEQCSSRRTCCRWRLIGPLIDWYHANSSHRSFPRAASSLAALFHTRTLSSYRSVGVCQAEGAMENASSPSPVGRSSWIADHGVR